MPDVLDIKAHLERSQAALKAAKADPERAGQHLADAYHQQAEALQIVFYLIDRLRGVASLNPKE